LRVYPRLVAAEHARPSSARGASGVAGVDAMLDGGLDRGTITLRSSGRHGQVVDRDALGVGMVARATSRDVTPSTRASPR